MVFWYGDPDCGCMYVKATLCAGESDPGYDVYVHTNDLPESTTVFLYADLCYTIDPSGSKVCLPKGEHRVAPRYDYETCTDCINRGNDDGESGGGSSEDGDEDGGGGISDTWPTPPPDYPDYPDGPWKKATICAAHSSRAPGYDVYVASSEVESGTYYFRHQGVCYHVSASDSDVDPLPDGAIVSGMYGAYHFDNCGDCTDGVEVKRCSDDSGIGVYVTAANLPASTCVFVYYGECVYLDPTDSQVTIPQYARILGGVADEYGACEDCGDGRQATLCGDQTDPGYDLWVREKHLPAEGETIIFRHNDGYNNLCWSIDHGATSVIPADAEIAVPPESSQYETCALCLCGESLGVAEGVKVELCERQDIDRAKNWWVRSDEIPDEYMVWRINGVCVHLSPLAAIDVIPPDAILVTPHIWYAQCGDCTHEDSDQDEDGDDTSWPPAEPPDEHPPLPPDETGDPDRPACNRAGQLFKCSDDSATGVYVDLRWYPAGTAIEPVNNVTTLEGNTLTAGVCYYVGATRHNIWDLQNGDMPNFLKRIYLDCTECEGGGEPCSDCYGTTQDDASVSISGTCTDQTGCDGYGDVYGASGQSDETSYCEFEYSNDSDTLHLRLRYDKTAETWSGIIWDSGIGESDPVYSGDNLAITCDAGTGKLSGTFSLAGQHPVPPLDCTGCTATVTL